MLQAALLAAIVAATAPEDAPIECRFPGTDAAEKTIRILLEPKPSLKDQPGLYRVIMEMNERVSLRASARPISSTSERDILLHAVTRKKSVYSLGLRDDGRAALNIRKPDPDGGEADKSTRMGHCSNFKEHMDRWLTSVE